eukprot:107018_1
MSGKVYGIGDSLFGANGATNRLQKWNHIKQMINITTIATGEEHSLCLNSEGKVLSLGYNDDGQLGLGTSDYEDHIEPELIPLFIQLHNICVIDIWCGSNHSVVLSNDGKVYTFGSNRYGECGNTEKGINRVLIPK